MKPSRHRTQFEKISTNDFVVGFVEDILYENEHVFKYKGEEKKGDACRFKFTIEGYKYPHSTPWMTFSYGEKTNLFKKYISSLVENAKPDMDFDLDQLKGMKVKMLWADKGDFQHIETIRPFDKKIIPVGNIKEETDDEVPF